MDRVTTMLAVIALLGVIVAVAGFWFAHDVYRSQENCEQMDAKRHLSANCWTLPAQVFVAGGAAVGLLGLAVAGVALRRSRTPGSGGRDRNGAA